MKSYSRLHSLLLYTCSIVPYQRFARPSKLVHLLMVQKVIRLLKCCKRYDFVFITNYFIRIWHFFCICFEKNIEPAQKAIATVMFLLDRFFFSFHFNNSHLFGRLNTLSNQIELHTSIQMHAITNILTATNKSNNCNAQLNFALLLPS